MAKRCLRGAAPAVILVLAVLLLPAAGGTDRLTVLLPDRAVAIPISSQGGFPAVNVESLARALGAAVRTGPGDAVELRWEGHRVRFSPHRRQVSMSGGTATLSALPRRRGSVLWVPVDAAAAAAREGFGVDRVRWDPGSRTLTVGGAAPDILALRIGSHSDRTRIVLEAAHPVDWAVTAEGDDRLVVALPGATMGPAITRRDFREGQLRAVDPIQGPSGVQVRLAFTGRADQARWFALPDPLRIVIDLYRPAPSPAAPAAPAASGAAESPAPGTEKVVGNVGGGGKRPASGRGAAAGGSGAGPMGGPAAGPSGGEKAGTAPMSPLPSAPAVPRAAARVPESLPALRADPAPGAGDPPAGSAGSASTPGSPPTTARGAVAGEAASAAEGASAPIVSPGRAEPPASGSAAAPEAGPAPAKSPPLGGANGAPPRPAQAGQLTIVIDPGHGGKDTGAIGPRGLKEKDVVLDIGLRLRRLLVDRLGARVVMTRSDDAFIPLEERTAMANRAHADFFISIHVNAAPQARASGVETYYLSREPSDLSARASAARENLVLDLEGISPGEQDGLKAVLWDMAESLHVQESSAMAQMLLEDLGRGLRVETRGVKHGPFVVLMTAGMPSSLVEVAFISNPNQERRLQEENYRHSIAVALSEGVERFAHRYQRRIGMQRPRPGPS